MTKQFHEIRDPIHDFIHLDVDERVVIESEPFQRLRHIHQLSMSHYIYPGATHTRFEHSLGVMEVAGRIYDVVTERHRTKKVSALEELDNPKTVDRWKKNLRIAALCHDMGHFPFSHASEALLPDGFDHETMTKQLIHSEGMAPVWDRMDTPVRPSEIADLAVEPEEGTHRSRSGNRCSEKSSSAPRSGRTGWTICFATRTTPAWLTDASTIIGSSTR